MALKARAQRAAPLVLDPTSQLMDLELPHVAQYLLDAWLVELRAAA